MVHWSTKSVRGGPLESSLVRKKCTRQRGAQIVIEFPDMEKALGWYGSDAYTALAEARAPAGSRP